MFSSSDALGMPCGNAFRLCVGRGLGAPQAAPLTRLAAGPSMGHVPGARHGPLAALWRRSRFRSPVSSGTALVAVVALSVIYCLLPYDLGWNKSFVMLTSLGEWPAGSISSQALAGHSVGPRPWRRRPEGPVQTAAAPENVHRRCSPRKVLFVVSDASGQTATALVNRLLVQYADVELPEIRLCANIRRPQQISDIVFDAEEEGANTLIFATLVDDKLVHWLNKICTSRGVPFVDVMTGLLSVFTDFLETPAEGVPGGVAALTAATKRKVDKLVNQEFFNMVEAMQFRQQHVSGLNRGGWPEADVLLVGCSRIGKSAISLQLAQRGMKVATLNLSPDEPGPRELSFVDPAKVFVLYVEPDFLTKLRYNRVLEHQRRRLPNFLDENYADPRRVRDEVSNVLAVAQRHPEWGHVVDCTYLGAEESCSVIVRLLKVRASKKK